MEFFTADLCDANAENAQIARPVFTNYGGELKCQGPIRTIKLNEHNADLVSMLQEDGEGHVAVVDVNGDYCAVVGENLMKFAANNNWAGIVINGYVRDIHVTKTLAVALFALGTCPYKSPNKAPSKRGVEVVFGGIAFREGEFLYGDEDGIVVFEKAQV
ncbi:MAG: ribonuclease E activity regulator RraA [Campylobacterota bacterium]|nr:ribonuclease E activity regulator RraA [Campylobacterota bacterium]